MSSILVYSNGIVLSLQNFSVLVGNWSVSGKEQKDGKPQGDHSIFAASSGISRKIPRTSHALILKESCHGLEKVSFN